MTDLFRTISGPGQGVYKEKGSKFLGFVFPVDSADQVKKILEEHRKEYHDARHHCYAWCLGPHKDHFRSNDDGEPSGSAGKPIFGQILSRDLTQLLVVVVRYFGGTKLGVGGLINAYRSAASDALDHSKIIECKVYDTLKLEFAYEQLNSVMKIVKDKQLNMEDQAFDMDCSFTLKSWKRHTEQVLDTFSKLGTCRIRLIAE
jgi:uncharacterized YigZ family protein